MSEALIIHTSTIELAPPDTSDVIAEKAELFALLAGGLLSESALWGLQGPCKDEEELFFEPSGREKAEAREQREAAAKVICAICTVREKCLEYATDNDERHGIWGGLDEVERRELRTKAA